jgi:C-terminal processing protease CtpA/Prc
VNELDFSGGDFFPATLQDNKRVTIIGTRTSGAGGYVEPTKFPNLFGLEMVTVTGSIAERIDKNPIENLGVTPDVQLPMTIEDYRNNFSHYLDEVKKILASKIP